MDEAESEQDHAIAESEAVAEGTAGHDFTGWDSRWMGYNGHTVWQYSNRVDTLLKCALCVDYYVIALRSDFAIDRAAWFTQQGHISGHLMHRDYYRNAGRPDQA
jgi:hypothetical protein